MYIVAVNTEERGITKESVMLVDSEHRVKEFVDYLAKKFPNELIDVYHVVKKIKTICTVKTVNYVYTPEGELVQE